MPLDTIDQELRKKREAHSSKRATSADTTIGDFHLGEDINAYHLLNRSREEKVFLEVSI